MTIVTAEYDALYALAHKSLALDDADRAFLRTLKGPPMATFTPTPDELAALEHIFTIAEGYSGGSVRARSLLGAWWNGGQLGGFDFADLWSLDAQAVTVVHMICRLPAGTYAHDLPGDFGPRMRALHERMVDAGEARVRPDEPG